MSSIPLSRHCYHTSNYLPTLAYTFLHLPILVYTCLHLPTLTYACLHYILTFFCYFAGWVPPIYWGTVTTCQILRLYMVQSAGGQTKIFQETWKKDVTRRRAQMQRWTHGKLKICTYILFHSMARANLNKSEKLVTNTTAAPKLIPKNLHQLKSPLSDLHNIFENCFMK